MHASVLLCTLLACLAVGSVNAGPRYQGLPQYQTSQVEDESVEEIDRNAVQPTQQVYLARPQPGYQRQQEQRGRPQEYSQGKRVHNKQAGLLKEEEEEEKEEPDRLALLLPQSKFTCENKNTGYYADEGLNCEVFHYCQDNARHSWVCPEGFLFHQVHLICMPPTNDICTQSSQYHFVNDFLYKPINAEEVHNKPNVTLRYSDRYYPENFYIEDVPQAPQQEQRQQHATPRPLPRPQPTAQVFQPRPTQYTRAPNQVFHSPEEVNIPLQQRRPIAIPQPLRGYHQQQQQQSEEYEY